MKITLTDTVDIKTLDNTKPFLPINTTKKDKNIYLTNIRTGTYSLQELIQTFGTDKQKTRTKIYGAQLQYLLSETSRYATVIKKTDIFGTHYIIKNLKKIPLPKDYNNMLQPIYRSLLPIILTKIIEDPAYGNTVHSLYSWCSYFGLFNNNYSYGRLHMEEISSEFNTSVNFTKEYYDRVASYLNAHLKHSFELLRRCHCLEWDFCLSVMDSDYKHDSYPKPSNASPNTSHPMTELEYNLYTKAMQICDNKYCIDSPKERYFGSKSDRWIRSFKALLSSVDIKYVYKTYTITNVNVDRCKEILSLLPKHKYSFYLDFSHSIIEHAEKRLTKNNRMSPEAINNYHAYNSFTLNPKQKKLISTSIDVDNYLEDSDLFLNEDLTD